MEHQKYRSRQICGQCMSKLYYGFYATSRSSDDDDFLCLYHVSPPRFFSLSHSCIIVCTRLRRKASLIEKDNRFFSVYWSGDEWMKNSSCYKMWYHISGRCLCYVWRFTDWVFDSWLRLPCGESGFIVIWSQQAFEESGKMLTF